VIEEVSAGPCVDLDRLFIPRVDEEQQAPIA
jgi:hypothetical protein